jgi:hypothetical protein
MPKYELGGDAPNAAEQLARAASNFDAKTLRYGLLARTNAGLAEAMKVDSYCSPLMRNAFWNGSEWVRAGSAAPLGGGGCRCVGLWGGYTSANSLGRGGAKLYTNTL